MKALMKMVPSWKAIVGIAVGVIVLRKIEALFPALTPYTYTAWPFDRLGGGNNS